MKPKFKKLGIMLMAMVAILCASTTPASSATSYGPYNFTTGDGEWDGQFRASSGNNVRVFINDWGGTTDWVKVRLCRVGGGCTIFKAVDLGNENTVTFTNMAAGTYHGDVAKVHNPGNQISGKISFRVY